MGIETADTAPPPAEVPESTSEGAGEAPAEQQEAVPDDATGHGSGGADFSSLADSAPVHQLYDDSTGDLPDDGSGDAGAESQDAPSLADSEPSHAEYDDETGDGDPDGPQTPMDRWEQSQDAVRAEAAADHQREVDILRSQGNEEAAQDLEEFTAKVDQMGAGERADSLDTEPAPGPVVPNKEAGVVEVGSAPDAGVNAEETQPADALSAPDTADETPTPDAGDDTRELEAEMAEVAPVADGAEVAHPPEAESAEVAPRAEARDEPDAASGEPAPQADAADRAEAPEVEPAEAPTPADADTDRSTPDAVDDTTAPDATAESDDANRAREPVDDAVDSEPVEAAAESDNPDPTTEFDADADADVRQISEVQHGAEHEAQDDSTDRDAAHHDEPREEPSRLQKAALSAAVLTKLIGFGGPADAAATAVDQPTRPAVTQTAEVAANTERDGPATATGQGEKQHRSIEQDDDDPAEVPERLRRDLEGATRTDGPDRPLGRPPDQKPRPDHRDRRPTPYRRNKGPR